MTPAPLETPVGVRVSSAIREVFSRRLLDERLSRGLSQRAAALAVGVSPSLFGRIEAGESLPSVATVRLVAEAWDLTTDELLGLVPRRDAP